MPDILKYARANGLTKLNILVYNYINIFYDRLNMLTIGLCGGSGSGKGFVSAEFKKYGIPSIDTDALYRQMTTKNGICTSELARAFGEEILSPDGSVDRVKLSKLVFCGENSSENKRILEKITHKAILDEVRRILSCYASSPDRPPAVLVDAPLLFESGFDKECQLTVCVICDTDTRLRRIISRDGITKERAMARILAQISDDKLSSMCDFTIVNDGIADTCEQVKVIVNNILRRR